MVTWLTAVVSTVAAASGAFAPLPSTPERGLGTTHARNGLEARVVAYNGSTNGTMTVEVRNTRPSAIEFVADGLYFVPGGDPDHAPQRLGAVGPYQAKGQRHERLAIAPGETVRADLDVYCIDSQRPSPSSSTPFSIAKERMPAKLHRAIVREATEASAATGGVSAPASKAAVQSTVWRNRDQSWIKLQGEGKQEAGK